MIAGVFFFATLAVRCLGQKQFSPDMVTEGITTEGNDLQILEDIARENGGNRAHGFPGYKASVDFVEERLKSRFGDVVDVTVQPFTGPFFILRSFSLTTPGPDNEPEPVEGAVTGRWTASTPLPGGVTGVLVDTPVNDERGSMCEESDWDTLVEDLHAGGDDDDEEEAGEGKGDLSGKVILVKRGICDALDRLTWAFDRGAEAVILWFPDEGPVARLDVGLVEPTTFVPLAMVELQTGLEWKERLAAGEEISVTLIIDAETDMEAESWNVLAETKGGDPDNVVMLGAHLDSVPAGPGINDNGSGSVALLHILESLAEYAGPDGRLKNKIRFAWWGAEEMYMVGSSYYVTEMSSEEVDKIRFYFNYDMLGSINPNFTVFDGGPIGSALLYDYLEGQGKNVTYTPFESSSDYLAFVNIGVQSSGMETGPADENDPCYHKACDTMENINWDALTVNTRAAGRAASALALSLEGGPRRNRTVEEENSGPERRKRRVLARQGSRDTNIV